MLSSIPSCCPERNVLLFLKSFFFFFSSLPFFVCQALLAFVLVGFCFFPKASAQCSCIGCTCDGSTPCPQSVSVGRVGAFVKSFSCASGFNVQLSHNVQATDGSSMNIYVMDDANLVRYQSLQSFTALGTSSISVSCVNQPSLIYARNAVNLVVECVNNFASCPIQFKTAGFCVAASTTSTSSTTIATTTTPTSSPGSTTTPSGGSTGLVDVFTLYSSATCTGAPVFQYSQPTVGSVCTGACALLTCSCTNGVKVQCGVSAPALLPGPSVAVYGQASCSGSAIASFSMTGLSACVPAALLQFAFPTLTGLFPSVTACGSVQFSCSNGQIGVKTFGQSSVACASGTDFTCSTTATNSFTLGTAGCVSLNGQGGGASALISACGTSSVCFHENTTISYDGSDYALEDFALNRVHDCVIPHQIQDAGVIVHAKCPERSNATAGSLKQLRLTSGHLIYTARGLVAAKDLTASDVLFADIQEQEPCSVVRVDREKEFQRYFGLNCLKSHVLANGLKASTFEKLHSIPSFWMAIMGRILGVQHASDVGDFIERLVSQMNLI